MLRNNINVLDCNLMEDTKKFVAVNYKGNILKNLTWVTDTKGIKRHIHNDTVCWQLPQSVTL